MVGDSTWDCEAAAVRRRDGRAPDGRPSDEELTEAGALAVFESLGELLQRLGETPLPREGVQRLP